MADILTYSEWVIIFDIATEPPIKVISNSLIQINPLKKTNQKYASDSVIVLTVLELLFVLSYFEVEKGRWSIVDEQVLRDEADLDQQTDD